MKNLPRQQRWEKLYLSKKGNTISKTQGILCFMAQEMSWKIETKIKVKYQCIYTLKQAKNNSSLHQDMEHLEFLNTVYVTVNWCIYFGNVSPLSSRVKCMHTMLSRSSIDSHMPNRNKGMYAKKIFTQKFSIALFIIAWNGKQSKCPSINTDKLVVVYLCKGILYSNEKRINQRYT